MSPRSSSTRAQCPARIVNFVGGYGYDELQSYMKSDELLMATATDPEWVREMITTLADLTVAMLKMAIERGVEFDGFWCGNDMGYRNGPLFSPET